MSESLPKQRSVGPITAAARAEGVGPGLYQWLTWRVKNDGRDIFAQLGDAPDENDPLIGTMNSRLLAEEVVMSHNTTLLNVQRKAA